MGSGGRKLLILVPKWTLTRNRLSEATKLIKFQGYVGAKRPPLMRHTFRHIYVSSFSHNLGVSTSGLGLCRHVSVTTM
jgi:hypothetical protein